MLVRSAEIQSLYIGLVHKFGELGAVYITHARYKAGRPCVASKGSENPLCNMTVKSRSFMRIPFEHSSSSIKPLGQPYFLRVLLLQLFCLLHLESSLQFRMKWIIVCAFLIAVASALPNHEAEQQSSSEFDGQVVSARAARYDERKFSSNKQNALISNDLDTNKKQQVSQFLTSKNVIRTLVKLIFGNDEESAATSKQILNIFVSVLDMLKSTLGQRARSATSRGSRAVLGDAASASASLLKGYIRAFMTNNNSCVQKYLCEASKEAVSDGREVGYLIAQIGGYAASYALENQKSAVFQENYAASRRGRSGEDCKAVYQICNEVE
ncbi:uncharacterized protein TNIN_408601 [Trichonephila inaurata madagascariensis]|uniref:Uncharacterized protein n=1 Tax=Trichonephila inaurata madagascariensis TaxID=2747483 RepID=A0A8X6YDR8_9ARAC|nr:uncharacterized protein TNIN_408601 [Trichonephila inaurata madagascariensis]